MRLLGVYREKVFSPGKIRDDAAILDATLLELSRMGHAFDTVEGEAMGKRASGVNEETKAPVDCILTMAQSVRTLEALERRQERGTRIVNSIASVRNTYRRPLIGLLKNAGLPMPASEIIATREVEGRVNFKKAVSYWLKRGDVHAVEPDDVVKVGSLPELLAAVGRFRDRKIGEILVQEHSAGDVIKFYGAGRVSYFSAFLATTGEEITSGVEELREIAGRAAEATGLEVWGGDAIVTPERAFVLIDFNDWPSFSRCRDKAATGIARYIANNI